MAEPEPSIPIEGRWYYNPGDIPAPCVFAVDLAADGSALWPGPQPLVSSWSIEGDELTLSFGPRQQIVAGPLDGDWTMLYGACQTLKRRGHGAEYEHRAVLMRDYRQHDALELVPFN